VTDALAVVAEQRVLPVVTVESRETAEELGRALAGAGAGAVEPLESGPPTRVPVQR